MTKLLTSNKIYLAESKMANAGRGVFAKVAIKKGEIIEHCPIIEIPKNDTSSLVDSILITYFYFFGKKKERMVIALGFGAIYNHTYEPNAVYKPKLKEKMVDFVAIRDIQKDEEITVNYDSDNQQDTRSLWFKVSKLPK